MDEIWLPGAVHRETEFVGGLTAACGPNALSMAERWADQSALTTLDVYHRMLAANLCATNGSATLAALLTDAQTNHYTVASLPYHEPMAEADWRDFFAAHVGRQAVVFETANGQALVDALTGKGENAQNLHYHFVLVAGWHPGGVSHHPQARGKTLPPGWWCADGDNFDVGDVLQFYPDTVLAASKPCGALAISAQAKNISGGNAMAVPSGWKDDGTTLTAPNGIVVRGGMRTFVLSFPGGWAADDLPLAAEEHTPQVDYSSNLGPGVIQIFRHSHLALPDNPQNHHIQQPWVGAEILTLRSKVAALQAQLAQAADPKASAALAAVTELAKALKIVAI